MPVIRLDCTKCDRTFAPGVVLNLCTSCSAPLFARYDLERAAKTLRPEALATRERSMWRYHEVMPVEDPAQRLSLGEGFTPLLKAPRLSEWLGLKHVMVKDEGGNPTGSFKARGLSAAVSMAKVLGAKAVCLPSAGNAGSALAAYAARGGLEAHVFVPKDIASLFLMETRAYGAHVETVDGLITDAGRVCAGLAREHGWYECATLKEPYRVEGKKTMGYELAEQLDWTLPDVILYPTGGGTGLIGMWKAFEEMEAMGLIGSKRPRMVAVQAEGCAPIVKAHAEGQPDAPMWPGATTHAHGLRVPKALGDFLILRAVKASGGTAISVTEEEIVQGTKELAASEGLFAAPEGGACVAALRKLHSAGQVTPDESVVVFNTGTGFKYVENMAPLW
ncbi:threonine synthase [Myxococcus sp. AM011]|uniref:threonine synthase n=1 Tax=Myxococcus sp. AM011 TaxID=2745200 RepID=UPI001595A8E8|nr:threonine synthase [Myxococcus sp. AM011]NVJ21096.1 threonine synthase [Myxococcus sp. AM011]